MKRPRAKTRAHLQISDWDCWQARAHRPNQQWPESYRADHSGGLSSASTACTTQLGLQASLYQVQPTCSPADLAERPGATSLFRKAWAIYLIAPVQWPARIRACWTLIKAGRLSWCRMPAREVGATAVEVRELHGETSGAEAEDLGLKSRPPPSSFCSLHLHHLLLATLALHRCLTKV